MTLADILTPAVCDFCQSAGLTYTDPETQCLYCLPCLVIAVEAEGKPEEAEAPEITQMGRDYIYSKRLYWGRLRKRKKSYAKGVSASPGSIRLCERSCQVKIYGLEGGMSENPYQSPSLTCLHTFLDACLSYTLN